VEADWESQGTHGSPRLQGEVVVSELVGDHLAEVEKLADQTKAVEAVPSEVELPSDPGQIRHSVKFLYLEMSRPENNRAIFSVL
jgi:hypothetical protein